MNYETDDADLEKLRQLSSSGIDASPVPLNSKFRGLSRSIKKSIIYADRYIKLTDLAVCMLVEDVGRTLRDIPKILDNDHYVGYRTIFNNIKIFQKHIFDLIYSLYCMNNIHAVLHGDLHTNNITIYPVIKDIAPDSHVAYIIGSDVYALPYSGYFSMIIDFSRSVVGDVIKLEQKFGEDFAQQYIREQHENILNMINQHFPVLVDKYGEILRTLVVSKFPIMFKILTAVDAFSVVSNIETLLQLNPVFKKNTISPHIIPFLKLITTEIEKFIFDNVQGVIDEKIKTTSDIIWPNLHIIKTYFSEFILKPSANITIVDIFNSNNLQKFTIDEYNSSGPIINLDKDIEMQRKQNIEPSKPLQDWQDYHNRDESEAIDKLNKKYEQSEPIIEDWMSS
jgi:hypothetical protein